MSVVRHFISTVVIRAYFKSSEVKQRSERSQIFHFNSSEVKKRSERSQRFHFNSSEVKQGSWCS